MSEPHIRVEGVTLAYGDWVVMQELDFTVGRGDIFIIMGGSGCGKSTLLRHLIGLARPVAGDIRYGDINLWQASSEERRRLQRRMGILYQSGALWTSLTLAENIALLLSAYTPLHPADIAGMVAVKLALVGLAGFEDYYPSELSGGMQKRAALARAIALDPEILFFDEPSAGLDPINARRMDDLILHLRDSLGSTVVIVTHELSSIFGIGTDSIFLDGGSKTIIGRGPPRDLLSHCQHPQVRDFLSRGAVPAA